MTLSGSLPSGSTIALLSGGSGADRARTREPTVGAAALRPPAVPPPWQPTAHAVDVNALIASDPQPLFVDSIELWEDDMHECGHTFLRARVYVAERFWVAYVRCFVRVDGVMCRVLDTRYAHRRGAEELLCETSCPSTDPPTLQVPFSKPPHTTIHHHQGNETQTLAEVKKQSSLA